MADTGVKIWGNAAIDISENPELLREVLRDLEDCHSVGTAAGRHGKTYIVRTGRGRCRIEHDDRGGCRFLYVSRDKSYCFYRPCQEVAATIQSLRAALSDGKGVPYQDIFLNE